jgi:hypothetical protein
LDAKSLSPFTLGNIVADQIALLQSHHIQVESYLANGVMIMEHISKSLGTDIVSDLPAGHRAINIWIVGTIVYIITYKNPPVGVKFVSEELANALHVMLGAIG